MSENKVVEIKLFGKTIQLGSNSNGDMSIAKRIDPSDATNDVDYESTSYDHNFLCSKQGENRGDEVRIFEISVLSSISRSQF